MSNIPQEVQADILSRLPVKSLLRFRSVSKPFCALIDSPDFANLHMKQSMRRHKILTFLGEFGPPNSIYSLCFNSGITVAELETPFDSIGPFHQILCSCNGLLCLSRGASDREILLWNPLTKKYKLIYARVRYPPGLNTFTIDRVGYDHVNDDYKVVRLKQYSRSDLRSIYSKVTVYSLKLDVWHSVDQDFPYHICKQRGHGVLCYGPMSHGVCVNGAIHWVVTQNPSPDMNYLIVAFDLSGQTFEMVPQPEYSDKYVAIDLGLLGGCLCVIGNHEMFCVDIWVMMKYGVKESWKKLVAMTICDVMMSALPNVRPIIYLKNGKKVLLELDNEWFVQYDLEKKKSKMTKIRDASYLSTFVCQETLF